jgi:hypothetical protein
MEKSFRFPECIRKRAVRLYENPKVEKWTENGDEEPSGHNTGATAPTRKMSFATCYMNVISPSHQRVQHFTRSSLVDRVPQGLSTKRARNQKNLQQLNLNNQQIRKQTNLSLLSGNSPHLQICCSFSYFFKKLTKTTGLSFPFKQT